MKRLVILSLSLLLTGAVFGQTSTGGTLETSSGDSITAEQLKEWTDEFLPPGTTCLVVLTECFGGDTAKAFAGDSDTAVISATSPGEVAYYGGYDDDAAGALDPGPGRTGQTVHGAGTAGKHPDETPSTGGGRSPSFVSMESASTGGNVTGREVVVYAGKPSSQPGCDNDQRDTIKNNFADEQSTNVTTVGGEGGEPNGWNKEGSAAGLRQAIKQAGDRIAASGNPSTTQFILFVTDHGDLHKENADVTTTPPQEATIIAYLSCFYPWQISAEDLLSEPDSSTSFSFFIDLSSNGVLYDPESGPMFSPGDWSMNLQTLPTGFEYYIASSSDIPLEIDGSGIVGDFPGEGVRVIFPVDVVDFVEHFFAVGVEMEVVNHTLWTWEVSRPSQNSGPISKPPHCNDPPQDFDGDGLVNLHDFADFQICFDPSGTPSPACACFDDNSDSIVDLTDYVAFEAVMGDF